MEEKEEKEGWKDGRKGRKGRMEEWKDGGRIPPLPIFQSSNLPSQNASRLTFHVSRFTHYVSRFTFHVFWLFGFLAFLPAQEFLARKLRIKSGWASFLAVLALLAMGALYEVIEFLAVVLTKQEAIGMYFLGMQGDQWDAQKDLLLTLLGSLLFWPGFSLGNRVAGKFRRKKKRRKQ